MKHLLPLTLVLTVTGLAATPSSAHAEDWMFRRSYYSHVVPGEPAPPPESVPQIRSAYRRPYVGTQPGFAVRGVYRFNRIAIWSGNSYDATYMYEGSINERP